MSTLLNRHYLHKTMLVKTSEGLEINVKDDAFNDMEALEVLTDLVDGNPFAIPKVCNLIMDKDEKKKLYDFYRAKDGKVHVEKFVEVLTEIMLSLGNKEKN